ncbi:NAD(+) diphosphatase [Lacisediminihabitans profunda]|uniref:NAD(+) diphosphatase n=1 Tax=Lacisediminihabitans profunda TaxID=2594790 RepID=A0A5C8USJ7_9MICO|nr:NAD(+) diphosphatase [Lacisediminihabitans profunda]TXN31227.1 NAD(+) diphosphatase [Lacisediminihabitans profunda]
MSTPPPARQPQAALPFSSLPLSRHALDRDYLGRNREGLFDELWGDPATRVLVLWKGNALLGANGRLALLPTDRVPDAELRLYLGRSLAGDSRGLPIVAAQIGDEAAVRLNSDPAAWANLRVVGNTLNDLDAGLFTAALALANWHTSHGFSPRTGAPTVPDQGGWVRRNLDDGSEIFPRTDPAIIVGIVDSQDRILLGHNAMWDANRYSLLAGFVEPGESLESAVIREVFEESGIRVVDPMYLGSQPWPFPASLMLGFSARVDPDHESTLTPDGTEILDLRWFSRAELADSLGEIFLPGSTSIARAILERWYGGPIDDGQQ